MNNTCKFLALLMSLILAFSMCAIALGEGDDGTLGGTYVGAPDGDYSGKIVILHSNDVHGEIKGYANIAYLKADYEDKGAEVILVDAGDFSQGSPYVSYSKGETAVTMMNAAGYDIVTLGNHEFDFGYAQLVSNLEKAEFVTICADVTLTETGETMLPAGCLWTTSDGTKLGFFGMETPETATKVNPGLITEISFKTFGDLYTSAQEAIDQLREEGADLVIGLVHLGVDEESATNGYRSIDLYNNVTGVDLLIDGHSHTVMDKGENGEPITSTGTQFTYIGVVVIDSATKTIEENYLLSTADMYWDEDVLTLAQGIIDEVDAQYGTVFATSEVNLNGERAPGNRTEETNLGDLITDAMLWKVAKEGGTEQFETYPLVCITNGGGIRAAINAGDVTMNDVHTVLPFGNTVAVIYVSGAELLEALEASTFCTPESIGAYPQTSGIVWTLDTTVEYDQGALYTLDGKETTYYAPASIKRVSIQSVNGEPFDINGTYAVVTNNFCAAGGDTYAIFYRAYSEGAGFDTGIPLDDAVVEYVQEVLGGVIGQDYAEPRGSETQILADVSEPAA